ncbi:hypothetical protein [Gordonia sp. N1V]|uniref:hypothetical protein n=1 Tax=Gordonia sp. N1V TaxID=3034163 RepID=UPI0023E0B821|nr:hypothetical protein [Gordonia sp. N1V]MDF3280914.1 hypothetical protein [Gordonia sp. N1V]
MAWFRRPDVLRDKVLDKFVVTLVNGEVIAGLLREYDDSRLVFVDVRVVRGHDAVPAEGVLYIDRARVSYMQAVAEVSVNAVV